MPAARVPAVERGVGQRRVGRASRPSRPGRRALRRSARVGSMRRRLRPPTTAARAPAPRPRRPRSARRAAARSASPTPGTPRTKFFVPSIGSMTHRRAAVAGDAVLLAEERVAGSVPLELSRSAGSTARSASVTGVRSGLVSTTRSAARNRDMVMASAASASACASRRSASQLGHAKPRRSPPIADRRYLTRMAFV